ncbi:hypothetical protein [Dendrosporobacter sp. 1207_IL3150]|uniref:hypothetical protein n=1 Tax=Dendrosporobacter sp. 1207_IL3150 TaxID=3084054 RepID=UPI002FD99411
MILYLLMLLVGLLIGYVYGKNKGFIIGKEQGKSEMPLTLRQQSLEEGYCVLCASPSCINHDSSSNNSHKKEE